MRRALEQARAGRLHILEKMNAVAAERIAPTCHRMHRRSPSISIPVDKIRELIGPGGKVIRAITAESGASIDVEDDGNGASIAAVDQASGDKALRMIREIVAEPEMGEVYEGVVRRITNFGAFVQILPNKDGLLHVSEIAHHRIDNVTDVLKEGDPDPGQGHRHRPGREGALVAQGADSARRIRRGRARRWPGRTPAGSS